MNNKFSFSNIYSFMVAVQRESRYFNRAENNEKPFFLSPDIQNETHIYVVQSSSVTSYTIFISHPYLLINLHVLNLTIENAGRCIDISRGSLHVYFEGNNRLTNTLTESVAGNGFAALQCANNGQLTIEGNVETLGSYHSPGIGAASGSDCKLIRIIGGVIVAKNHQGGYCPAIGSGFGFQVLSSRIDTLIIDGGEITAQGSRYGAAIGTGWGDLNGSTINSIQINGGAIRAKCGLYSAGIGTGMGSVSSASKPASGIGSIVFNGGYISISGNEDHFYAALLGAGYGLNGTGENAGNLNTLNISGGMIRVKAETKNEKAIRYGAIMGSGFGSSISSSGPKNSSNVNEINIMDGELEVLTMGYDRESGTGVGLGGGFGNDEKTSNVQIIRIGTTPTQNPVQKFDLKINVTSDHQKSPAIGSNANPRVQGSGQLYFLEIGEAFKFLYVKSGIKAIEEKPSFQITPPLICTTDKKICHYPAINTTQEFTKSIGYLNLYERKFFLVLLFANQFYVLFD